MAAQLTEGEDAYLANLENIRAQINNFQKVDSRDSQALFEIPILKLYSKDIEQGQDPSDKINMKFCLKDLESMSDSDLERKVFVHASSPNDLNLDDDLILKTKFWRIKK